MFFCILNINDLHHTRFNNEGIHFSLSHDTELTTDCYGAQKDRFINRFEKEAE